MRLPGFVRTQRRKVTIGLACLVLSGAAALWVRAHGETVPTAEVKKGEWIDNVELRGEVKALRSISLSAPSNAGELQILKIVPSGTVPRFRKSVLSTRPRYSSSTSSWIRVLFSAM